MQDEQINHRKELTTQEASQISGLSRNHITLLLRQAKLEGRNFGQRLWTVYADSLERYIATHHKSGPKGPRKKPALESQTTSAPAAAIQHDPGSDKS